MSVGSFDPSAQGADLDLASVRALLDVLAGDPEHELSTLEQNRFAVLVTHAQWSEQARAFTSAEIEVLIRAFTLGEERYNTWRADEKSAVVPLVKALKAQGAYDKSLTRWIKSNTTNKFLPHGSLMDRL